MKFNQKAKRKKEPVLGKSQLHKNHQKMLKIRKTNLKLKRKAHVSIFNDHMSLILLSITSSKLENTSF